jgi:hypothetical protein
MTNDYGNREVLCFSLGLPGRLSDWCDVIIAYLAGQPGSPALVEQWPSNAAMLRYDRPPPVLGELGRLLIANVAADVVIASRQPDMGLRDALASSGARFVIALDQPRLAVAELLARTGADLSLVTRAVANSCAMLMHFPALSGALVLHGNAVKANPTGTVVAMAGHFGLEIGESEAGTIIEEVAQRQIELLPRLQSETSATAEFASKTVGGALFGYEDCFAGRGHGRLVWNRDLFIASDSQGRANQLLDLTGGVRTLVRGPYMRLPPGSWSARIHLGLSPEAAQCPLSIEIWEEVKLAATTLQPHFPGIHVADLSFSLAETQADIEVRVMVLSPDARGRLAFGYVVLTPAGAHHPQAETEWEEEFRRAFKF